MFSGRKRWQSRKDGIQLVGANERQRRMLKVGELKYTAFIIMQYRAAMRIGHYTIASFDYIYQNALRCNLCNDMTHFTSFSAYNGYKLNSHLTCFRRGFIAQSVDHRTGIAEVMGLGFICNCLSYFTTAKISFTSNLCNANYYS